MGYRGFDAAGIAPAFPFGYGLSYTDFAYSQGNVALRPDGTVEVGFSIKNVGSVAGDEVAQVYVAPPPDAQRPPQKLEGYARVSLPPGAERRETIVLPQRAFAFWNGGWKIAPGHYAIYVGSSSRDRKLTLGIELRAAELAQ